MKGNIASALLLLLWLSAATLSAQFVEVEAELDVTTWNHQDDTGLVFKSRRQVGVRCVVGTNAWFMENLSRTNYKESVWFLDGKVIRQFTATGDSGADPDEGIYVPTRRGGRTANVLTAEDGYPTGDLFVTVPWFAFCSGPYLRRPGRSVPLPAVLPDTPAFGFKDETTVFKDPFGLPQRVDLFTTKGQLKCEYRVQQSTNVLGWNFPTAFTLIQNEPTPFEQLRRQLSASGRLVRIRRASKPELPPEIKARLEMLERYPSRRR